MMCRVKTNAVQIAAAIFLVVVVGVLLEGFALADPSQPGEHPHADLLPYLIRHNEDSYMYKAGTLNQPGYDTPSEGEVFVGKNIEHLTYKAEDTEIDCSTCHPKYHASDPSWNDCTACHSDAQVADLPYFEHLPYDHPKISETSSCSVGSCHPTYHADHSGWDSCVSCHAEYEFSEETSHPAMTLYNGQVRITLDVVGAKFFDLKDEATNPLVELGKIEGPGDELIPYYVEVIDDLDDFVLLYPPEDSDDYVWHWDKDAKTMTWWITNPEAIIDGKLKLTYTLALDFDRPSFEVVPFNWYYTGEAHARFRPNPENTKYWELTLGTTDKIVARISSSNWNAGNGLNWLHFIDLDDLYSFRFPSNVDSAKDRSAFIGDPKDAVLNPAAIWNYSNPSLAGQEVTVTRLDENEVAIPGTTRALSWHLEWSKGTHLIFTVKDLVREGTYTQYIFPLSNNGGSITGGSIIRNDIVEDWAKIEGPEGNEYQWEDDVLLSHLGLLGGIQPVTTPSDNVFMVNLFKDYGDDPLNFHGRWGQYDNTIHEVRFQLDDGSGTARYLVLIPDLENSTPTQRVYQFDGVSLRGTYIDVSVNTPTRITGIPATDIHGAVYEIMAEERDPWDGVPRRPDVSVTYQFDENEPNTTGLYLRPEGADYAVDTTLTVTNQYESAAYGSLRVTKTLDGFPQEWGIGVYTDFAVRIWDNDGYNGPASSIYGNYLLFRPRPETGPESSWPYGYEEGTLYCSGNTGEDTYPTLESYLELYEHFLAGTGPYAGNGTRTMDDWMYGERMPNGSLTPAGEPSPDPWFWSDKEWQEVVLKGDDIVLTELVINASQAAIGAPVRVSNLWPGPYSVHETSVSGRTPDDIDYGQIGVHEKVWTITTRYGESGSTLIADDRGDLAANGTLVVDVENSFVEGFENLTVMKYLIGPADQWGVDGATAFPIRIWNEDATEKLLFVEIVNPIDPAHSLYLYVGTEDLAGIRTPRADIEAVPDLFWPSGDIYGSEVKDRGNIYPWQSTVFLDLFRQGDEVYIIEEINPSDNHSARLLIDGVDITDNEGDIIRAFVSREGASGHQVIVANSFLNRQYGRIILFKELDPEGAHASFGVDEDTQFRAYAVAEGGVGVHKDSGGSIESTVSLQGMNLLFHNVEGGHGSTYYVDAREGTHWHFIGVIDDDGNVYQLDWPTRANNPPHEGELIDGWEFIFRGHIDDLSFYDANPGGAPGQTLYSGEELTQEVIFSVNNPAQICRFVPLDYRLFEEEVDNPNHNDHFTKVLTNVGYMEYDNTPPPHGPIGQYSLMLTLTNTYDGTLAFMGDEELAISKELAGDPDSWEVSTATSFTAELQNKDTGNTIALLPNGVGIPGGAQYIYFGEYDGDVLKDAQGNEIPLSDALAKLSEILGQTFTEDDIVTSFAISELLGARISNLPKGNYQVAELNDSGIGLYMAQYRNGFLEEPTQDGIELDGNLGTVFVRNTFAGPGEILINKDLRGAPGDWGVDNDTLFKAQIQDDEGNTLLFSKEAAGDDSIEASRTYVGYSKDGVDTYVSGFTGIRDADYSDTLNFSVNNPVLLARVPVHPRNTYTITEFTPNDVYGVSIYEGTVADGTKISDSETATFELFHDEVGELGRIFTIANDYLNKERAATTIYKDLAGDWAAYEGVSVDTTFSAYMTSLSNDTGRKLLFEPRGERDFASGGGSPDMRDVYRFVGELDEDGETIHRLVWLSDTARAESHNAAWDWDDSETLTDQGYVTVLTISGAKPANVYGLPPGEYEVFEDTTGLASYITVSYASNAAGTQRSNGTIELADRNSGQVTIANSYRSRTATLEVSKEFTGSPGDWGVTDTSTFKAVLLVGGDNVLRLVFELDSQGEYVYAGTYDSDTEFYDLLPGFSEEGLSYEVEFTKENAATLKGIPVASGASYQIEELNPGDAYDVDIALDSDDIRKAGVIAALSDEFTLSEEADSEIVFTNKYYAKEEMTFVVEKYLEGSFERFGVKEDDTFKAELSLTEGDYLGVKLYFKSNADGSYQLVGALDGASILELAWNPKTEKSASSGAASWSFEEYEGELPEGWTSEIELSKSKSAILLGMVFGYYQLEELYVTDFVYTVDYDGFGQPGDDYDPEGGGTEGGVELYEAGLERRFTVINNWAAPTFLGEGILNVTKTIAGNPASWGVNNGTEFEARLQRAGTTRRIALIEDTTSLVPNTWIYVGEVTAAGGYVDSTGAVIVIQDALDALEIELGISLTTADIKASFPISRTQGATIVALESVSYQVIETNNTALGSYTISYNPGSGTVTMADNILAVGVTNTFSTKPTPPVPPAPKPAPTPAPPKPAPKPAPKPPVQQPRPMPRTGDFANIGLWILLIGAAGTAGVALMKKTKGKKGVGTDDSRSQDE